MEETLVNLEIYFSSNFVFFFNFWIWYWVLIQQKIGHVRPERDFLSYFFKKKQINGKKIGLKNTDKESLIVPKNFCRNKNVKHKMWITDVSHCIVGLIEYEMPICCFSNFTLLLFWNNGNTKNFP